MTVTDVLERIDGVDRALDLPATDEILVEFETGAPVTAIDEVEQTLPVGVHTDCFVPSKDSGPAIRCRVEIENKSHLVDDAAD